MKRDESPTFYWELDGNPYAEEYAIALEDEGFLANDLLYGAKLLRTPTTYLACPPEVPLPPEELEDTAYSDAIAAILQVAEWNGHDAETIAETALRSQQTCYEYAAEAAHHREQRAYTVEP